MSERTEQVTTHRTTAELEAAVDDVRASPTDRGELALVVRRPAEGEREVLDEARLTFAQGVEGDTWDVRGSRRTEDGSSHPDMQLNVMNVRFARFVAGRDDRVPLAGDQLYVDLDLSEATCPPGRQLAIGDPDAGGAVIEVTDQPHTGCAKFVQRFGLDAQRFTATDVGRELKLRGVNARVVVEGTIRPGDPVTVID